MADVTEILFGIFNQIYKEKNRIERIYENWSEEEKFDHAISQVLNITSSDLKNEIIESAIDRQSDFRAIGSKNEIKSVQKRIQEESLKLDNKLISIVEKENIVSGESGDHSLAMKVADEVVRIEMNLFRMDKSIKGYKQLSKAVERIKNNFTAQGYEIVDMLGATYNEGMRINADFVIDESLAEGSRIITSITKPQINYMGQMIQKAIVTVSQNI